MRTLHFTNAWHETSGGIATFYRALMQEANRRGHAMRMVVPGSEDRMEEAGPHCRIYYIRSPKAPMNSEYRMIHPSEFLLPGSKLQKILAQEQPDLIEVCDKYTLNYLAGLLRERLLHGVRFRPAVVGLSCERMDDNFRSYLPAVPLRDRISNFYMRRLYFPLFDYHIANSQYTAEELRRAGVEQLTPRSVWIRPMGVDFSQLSPSRRKPEMRRRLLQNFGVDETGVLLLYVGRLVPEKNLALLFGLIEHFARRPEDGYRLLVVGDGIERELWERQAAKSAPGQVVFLGHMRDRAVLADLYANADVFVHPNPREPFGIAPLEAMASGVPIVVPNSGGVLAYANDQNAWTASATVEDFAQAVRSASAGSSFREEKIRRALLTAERYRWENVAGEFLDLYGEFCRMWRGQEPELLPDFSSSVSSGAQKRILHLASVAVSRGYNLVAGHGSRKDGSMSQALRTRSASEGERSSHAPNRPDGPQGLVAVLGRTTGFLRGEQRQCR
jgi:alpha-1,6-mannosyltransferase